jgi:hypothetical protein
MRIRPVLWRGARLIARLPIPVSQLRAERGISPGIRPGIRPGIARPTRSRLQTGETALIRSRPRPPTIGVRPGSGPNQ